MKYILFILVLCGSLGYAQYFYTNKYEPMISDYQAQISSLEKGNKETRSALEKATSELALTKNQLSSLKTSYDKKLSDTALQVTTLTSKLQEAQKAVLVTIPQISQIPAVQQASSDEHTVEMPDGSVIVVKSSNTSSVSASTNNSQLQAKLAADRAAFERAQKAHDSWSGRGNIPNDISQAAVDALERRVRLDEAGLAN